jgi:GAF domain-containing protein
VNEILKRSGELMRCPIVSIGLLNKAANRLDYRFAIGEQEGLSLPLDRGLGAEAARTCRPVRVGDVTKDSRYFEHLTDTRSELDVPLLVGDELIGILNAESPYYNAFGEEDEKLAVTFASQVAVALYNAELYQRAQEQFKQQSALVDFGRAVTSGIRLREDEVLDLIYCQASKLMDTNNMYVALYDEKADTVLFPLVLKDGQRIEWPPRRGGRGRTDYIIRTKESIFLPTRQESEDWYKQPDRQDYTRASLGPWMGVPMMVGEKVLGVIATYSPTRDYAFDQADFDILKSLANIAAIALDNARLYYDVNERLGILHQLGNDLTSKLRLYPQEIVERIYQRASELMDTGNMYIALYDEGTDTVSFPLLMRDGLRSELPPRRAGQGRTEYIIRTRQPIFLPTRQESEDWYKQPGRAEYIGEAFASWMGVPMLAGDKVVGVIATYHPEKEYLYDQDDSDVLTSLANVAAIALDNAALYHRIDLAQTVREIDNAIETYAELPRFLQSILELSLPRVGAKAGTIQLLNETRDELIVRATVGQVTDQRYRHISLSQGITGQAAREGCTVYAPDTRQTKEFLPYLGQMLSEMAVPLKAGGQVIGVLNVEDARVDAFHEKQQELLELIADQVSVAIQQKLRLEEEQKKRMAAELDAEVGQLARDIAHYVKNQIGMVRLDAIDLLDEKAIISEAIRNKCLERIRRNAELTLKLANDLFAPYKREEAPEWIEVASLVSEAIGLVRFEGINYEVDLPSALPKVFIDKSGAVEVFQELFVNARKAMATWDQAEKWIHVEGQIGNDNYVEVFVINNGPPIPSDRWDTIFRQFQQMTGRDEQPEGVGLGLWIARTFMRRQGGEVRVHHSNERETAFLVRFPVPPQE